jgi:hypothetical protein
MRPFPLLMAVYSKKGQQVTQRNCFEIKGEMDHVTEFVLESIVSPKMFVLWKESIRKRYFLPSLWKEFERAH